VVRFYWRYGEREIYYELLEEATPERLAFWFIHPFFPLYLSLERYFVLLHCGTVETEKGVVLFLAPFRGGKSTLVDYFLRQGHRLITDDVLPTFREEDTLLCAPSHPYHRPFRGPETLGYHTHRFKPQFYPVRAIYVLERGSDGTAPSIEPVKGIEKFMLLRNKSVIYLTEEVRRDHDLHLARMLDTVPFFRITREWGMEALPQTYEAIIRHIEEQL
jgi:hypothetical protein